MTEASASVSLFLATTLHSRVAGEVLDMNRIEKDMYCLELLLILMTLDWSDHYLKYPSTAFSGIEYVTFPLWVNVMSDYEKEEILEKGLKFT